MERDKAKKILLFCKDIDGEISLNKRLLQDYEDRYYTMGGSGSLDGMPKGNYKTSSPTEAVVLNIPESTSTAMKELRQRNKRLCELKDAILSELNKLPLPQKTIIYNFYIRGMQWVQIMTHVKYSGTQCKKIRNRALDNLAGKFSQNEIIEKFNYPS